MEVVTADATAEAMVVAVMVDVMEATAAAVKTTHQVSGHEQSQVATWEVAFDLEVQLVDVEQVAVAMEVAAPCKLDRGAPILCSV